MDTEKPKDKGSQLKARDGTSAKTVGLHNTKLL